MGKIYIGDIGTRLRTTLNADLAGYYTIKYKIEKPSGSVLIKPCFVEDEANGIIYYDTISGDFDESGIYSIQTDIIFTDGNKNLAETKRFDVHDVYK